MPGAIQERINNSVKHAWSYPGADADSDHNLNSMKADIKFNKIHLRRKDKNWDTQKLLHVNGSTF